MLHNNYSTPALLSFEYGRQIETAENAAGSSLSHALSVRVYFADISKLGDFNAVYSDFMGPSKPARAVVPVPDMLPFGSQLEVEAIAAVPSIPRSRL